MSFIKDFSQKMTSRLLLSYNFFFFFFFFFFFYKFYQDKFAECDTGLLIKDGWNGQSWFLMNGKSRKNPQKHDMCKTCKG